MQNELREELGRLSEVELLTVFLRVLMRPGDLTMIDLDEIDEINAVMVRRQMAARA